jgi:putative phosphoribosyl transferase
MTGERPERWFRDREDAGRQLARELMPYRGTGALVLGIPRGGVVVAAEVARALGAELDVIVVRKLVSPFSPELAIGAVTADGGRFLNDDVILELSVPEAYIEAVTRQERAEARRREDRFRGDRPPPAIRGHTVIIVDDGLATGATMHAAVRSVRGGSPGRLVVAVPVGAPPACAALRREVDELVCLEEPEWLGGVGRFYRDFEPTENDEVQRLLTRSAAAVPA